MCMLILVYFKQNENLKVSHVPYDDTEHQFDKSKHGKE